MLTEPKSFEELEPFAGDSPDDVLIIFASPEERCLGIAQRLSRYKVRHIALIAIADEPNDMRDHRLSELHELCGNVASLKTFSYRHDDPVYGVAELAAFVQSTFMIGRRPIVAVDISTFPRNSLLLTLAAIERVLPLPYLRILYSEPKNYQRLNHGPASFGLKRITVIPSFVAPFRPQSDLALVLFLGHERDRAMGIWQSIEPNRTIAILPVPSYHSEWEGLSERLNAPLIAGLPMSSVRKVDPRNPLSTYELLCRLNGDFGDKFNVFIAPLGTKPQAVGVYAFMRDNPNAATAVYTAPIEHSHAYISTGVGDAWELPTPVRLER